MSIYEEKICCLKSCAQKFLSKHKNQKYCSEACRKEANRINSRERMRILRKSKKRYTPKEEFEVTDIDNVKQNIVLPNFDLRLFQELTNGFSMAINQQFAELKDEIKQIIFVLTQEPAVRNDLLKRETLIQVAFDLLEKSTFQEFKIRQYLEKKYGLSKFDSEGIMKEALDQFRRKLNTRRY